MRLRCSALSNTYALAKRSNIVCQNDQTFEICLSSKMFNRFATSRNIACLTCLACVKQKKFLNFFKSITPQILLDFACQTLLVKHVTSDNSRIFCNTLFLRNPDQINILLRKIRRCDWLTEMRAVSRFSWADVTLSEEPFGSIYKCNRLLFLFLVAAVAVCEEWDFQVFTKSTSCSKWEKQTDEHFSSHALKPLILPWSYFSSHALRFNS